MSIPIKVTGSPYENLMGEGYTIDRGVQTESDLGVRGPRFGEYLGGGGKQTVFQDAQFPDKVLKVYNDTYIKDINGLKDFNRTYPKDRNTIPFQESIKLVGYVKHPYKNHNFLYPVYQQKKLSILKDDVYFRNHVLPRIQKSLNDIGFKGDGVKDNFTNGKITLVDVKAANTGIDSQGKIRFIDVDSY